MNNEELNTEQVEEAKENNQLDINELLPGAAPIEKPNLEATPYDKVIEEARLAFMKKYSAGRRNSYIAMGVVLALAIGSVVCISMNGMALKIVGWSLVGVAIVGMLLYYILTRNSLPKATKDYIAIVNEQLNTRNFADTRYTEVSTDKAEKVELSEPISDGIYLNLTNIASRNVINGKFDGRTFKVADMGLYKGQGRKRETSFVGKYYTYPNDLHFEGRYIIVHKGNNPVDLPDDLTELVPLIEDGDFIIYGKEGNKPASDLGQKFIDKIKAIAIERHLLHLNVVVWSGRTAVYASYDDSIMALPYEKPFDKEPNEQFAKDMLSIFNASTLVVEKEK